MPTNVAESTVVNLRRVETKTAIATNPYNPFASADDAPLSLDEIKAATAKLRTELDEQATKDKATLDAHKKSVEDARAAEAAEARARREEAEVVRYYNNALFEKSFRERHAPIMEILLHVQVCAQNHFRSYPRLTTVFSSFDNPSRGTLDITVSGRSRVITIKKESVLCKFVTDLKCYFFNPGDPNSAESLEFIWALNTALADIMKPVCF
jgi:hypothetical protein